MIGTAGSLFVCLLAHLSVRVYGDDTDTASAGTTLTSGQYEYVEVFMPNTTTTEEDAYLAISVRLPSEDAYLVGFEPRASSNTVHHMLLYGCQEPTRHADGKRSVLMGAMCASGPDTILYGWAQDAPKLDFPDDVGIIVGGEQPVKWVVLQVLRFGDDAT
eukprot:9490594-Pyramimonas_sp.AAC.1